MLAFRTVGFVPVLLAGCGSVVDSPDAEPAPRDGGQLAGDAGSGGMDAGDGDANDGGTHDGAPGDAGANDGSANACEPDAVEFPAGGSLEVGTNCDDIVVCASDDPQAELIRAADPSFDCMDESHGCGSPTCIAHVEGNVLDTESIAGICELTRLSPRPRIICQVYL